MSDPDFDRLRQTKAPAPSAEGRAAALAAAMDAFEDAQAKKTALRKGSASTRRPTSASPSWAWRMIMQNRMVLGGVAACLVAAPIAAVLVAPHGWTPPSGRGADKVAQANPPAEAPKMEAAEPEALEAVPPPPPAETRAAQQAQRAQPPLAAPMDGAAQSREPLQSYVTRPASPPLVAPAPEPSRDRFVDPAQNGVKVVAQEPISTFSIDADTASYAWVRRALSQGRLPAPEEVRVEELINYFPYDYAAPDSAATPFRPTVAVYPTPWNKDTRIVHIGIKGFQTAPAARPRANLVFLIDTSGSMNEPDKLPLVKTSLKLLLDTLQPDDHVALVTYAGSAGVALEPTRAADRDVIAAAIDRLGAGGSTAGAAGIEEAYRLARKSFDKAGVNRVMLATDGDFNVGVSDDDGLQRLVEREKKAGVFLSVLGFGQGNYNDAMMQRLAQNGDGTAAYIDTLEEAQKTLVEEATSTLFPIAKDVKIQVEFNPATVSEYRLIGYETRALNRTDFNDDKVDAGEVGSGSAVTALYEITPSGSPARLADDLRYAPTATAPARPASGEYGFLKLRYKQPNESASRLIEQPIGKAQEVETLAGASDDVRFAAAVAAFGQKLKGNRAVAAMTWDEIAALAQGSRGADRWGYRAGFVRLVGLAKALSGGK